MGAIFAIEKDGVVYLAADAIKECCDVNFYVNKESNLRLHKMPSGIIVAASGPMLVTQRLWLHDEWFELEEGEIFDKKFIVTKIIPRFYEAIKDLDVWEEKKERFLNETQAGFIIAKDADIYMVFSNLSVIKCDKIAAMSDEDADMIMLSYANACLEDNPEKVIKQTYAFTAGKNANISTHGFIINTKDFTFKKMEDVQ
jgi:ATP-dependent protease HslVU (ClpYQ) peptidase subunit